ncbi:MAG: glycosyltransferase [Sphingobacterium sp.]
MKILQVGKFYPIEGGVEKVMYNLLLGISERQINCDMLCAALPGASYQDIQINAHARILLVPSITKIAATMISPMLIIRLRKIASSYDIIHIHHPDPMACLALLFSNYKGKVILHWHSDILKQKNLLKIYKPLQSWLINRANLVVGTTPIYVQQSPWLKNVRHKIDYIPIGVEPMISDRSKVSIIKESYKEKKIIFSLGRLVDYKGHQYLIEAASILGEDYQILLGGTGPLREQLEKQIKTLGVENNVKLLGYISQKDLPDYYAASTAFCLPSILKTEGFAIVQVESMSAGRPIVSTDIPESGVSWVNADKETGYIVPICDSRAIASAIVKICEDPLNYEKLSQASLKRYLDLFTKSKMIDRSIECYKKLTINSPNKI